MFILSKILVTGGAGYIGTHTVVELKKAGYDFLIYDNFSNSSVVMLQRVKEIIGEKVKFIQGDIRDKKALQEVFNNFKIYSVIHFAGLKAVGESVENPLRYYDNNVAGTLKLLEVMKENGCKNIIFSSSATVYGNPNLIPVKENFPVKETTNAYASSKYIQEIVLQDLYRSDNEWNIVILRYFNPVGAHKSGHIGELPNGLPNNLMPYIAQVAIGKLDYLNIFGNNYNTKDGTGVRDYIHVVDLANAHIKALNIILTLDKPLIVNIGTGKGFSVLDLVRTYEKISGKKIACKIKPKRKGDIAECYADASYAKKILKWKAKYSLEDMCRDSWNFQQKL